MQKALFILFITSLAIGIKPGRLAAQTNAPTNLAAAAQNSTSIKLTWTDNSTNETGFEIEQSADNRTFTKVTDAAANATTFTITGLRPSTLYYFRVRAKFATGTSNYSNTANATTPATPPVVTNLAASASGTTSILLTWTDVGKEASYNIERRTGQSGSFVKIATNTVNYTDNGLSPGTEYCYRVQFVSSVETAGYSNIACATTQQSVPNAPARLTATAVSSSQINLAWADISDNETGFEVERSPDGSTGWTKIADVGANTTTYSSTGLSASTRYFYRVRAKNGVGNSGYSNTADATTQNPPLAAPQNLVATAVSTTQINLTWNGVSGATGYQLERSPNGTDPWTKIADPASGATTYSDPSLTPNTRYYYRIRAVISGAAFITGPYSNIANALTPDTPPSAPARLTATAVSFSQINLAWADLSGNESGFQIERSATGNDPWTKIADVGANTTSYNDQSLQPLTRYFYRIRAVNAAGNSGYSNTADATTPDAPPAAPQSLSATAASTTQINLGWSANVTNATGIQVERSPNGTDSWTKIADVGGNATTYTDQNLTPNTRYYYRIRAANGSGNGPYSNVANALTPDAPPVAPARLTAVAVSFGQINLAWADLSGNEAGFQIERSLTGTDGWTKIADPAANATTYSDQSLNPRTRYFYRVRAINAAGPSPYSNTADATTPDSPPAAPTRLTATASSNSQINLAWTDAADNETGFELQRSPEGTNWTKIADLPANTATFSNTGLTPNTRYYYRLRAVNAVGQSAYSNVADATTPDVPPVAPARLTATVISTSQINLAWADLSTNESGFEVERGSSATGTFTKIADLPANATTYEDKNLTDNTTYCYRIRAKNAAGNSAYTDAPCATTPLAPPATPTNLTAQVSDYDQIKLNWAATGTSAVTILIERSTSPTSGFTEIKQQPASPATYTDMGLQEFTTYYYRIKAVNAAGSSGYSNIATARVEEVIIAVEDELATHTTLFVNQRSLHVVTNWFTTAQTTIQLQTTQGRTVLTDSRKVRPAERWNYDLDTLPTGLYIITIVADGRKLAKRILLP